MNKIEENSIFTANTNKLSRLYTTQAGVVSFSIPIYQRNYDWKEDNIKRLFEDLSTGLFWLAEIPETITFLGTIIVLNEKLEDEKFEGTSFSVIDGQQRLTTFSLVACSLYNNITHRLNNLSEVDSYVATWIEEECKSIRQDLINFIYGSVNVPPDYFRFPRIVRENIDYRANNNKDSEYKSPISIFLNDFGEYINNNKTNPPLFEIKGKDKDEDKEIQIFDDNFKYILNIVNHISHIDELEDDSDDLGLNLPPINAFKKAGYRKLFTKVPADDDHSNKIFTYCVNKGQDFYDLLRLMALAKYFANRVLVTLVTTDQERYAFDIFDALNTTGEPLTAIQTFKPQVIKFENRGYKGSDSEDHLILVEEYLNTSKDVQKESAQIIVNFATYITGDKIGEKLETQRSFLRQNFESRLQNSSDKRSFVKRLRDIAEFKNLFWTDEIYNQLRDYEQKERELLLLCLMFLKDLNNTLTIPILCRYYVENKYEKGSKSFSSAIKAVTGYVVLRRAFTFGTDGIDSELRRIMNGKKVVSPPLCTGLKNENELVDVEILKKSLLTLLEKKIRKKNVKDSLFDLWFNGLKSNEFGLRHNVIARFLLLAASHKSRYDSKKSWLLSKARESSEIEYLTYRKWTSKDLSTIEHIAPKNPNEGEWVDKIYNPDDLSNTIGNLTLLPKDENTTLGNGSWEKKRLIYKAFVAEKVDEVDQIRKEAGKLGHIFSKKCNEIIDNGRQLSFLKPIAKAEEWNNKTIEERTENIAKLAWDEIFEWLD